MKQLSWWKNRRSASAEIGEVATLTEELRRQIAEQLGGCAPGKKSVTIDLVNLDRGGRDGLVYLDGAIVRKGTEILDGRYRLKAMTKAGRIVRVRFVQVPAEEHEPLAGAIYVPAGPTPDYIIDRGSQTILIHRAHGESITPAKVRDTGQRAFDEFFSN